MSQCAACQAQVDPGSRFCAQCGAAIETAAPDEGERRQLTTMFCDLVGSTELSSRLDPEEYSDIVHAYHRCATEVIERHGGHVDQLLGDGVLVFFGWPEAHEDDAERALRAGLELVGAVPRIEASEQLVVRVGVHTGPVVVSEGGRRETKAMGQTLNLAARLQSLAEPGTVVVSAATERLARGLFVFDDLGEHELKGVPEPVRASRAVAPTQARGRLAAASGLTPFVGRDVELAILSERWSRTGDDGGQAVILLGEPGIGKSRLIAEFRGRLDDTPHLWLECACSAYTQFTAFRPVIELAERALNLSAEESPEAALAKVRESLAGAGVHEGDALLLVARLLSIAALPEGFEAIKMSPTRQRRRTIEVLSQWLLGISQRTPLVMFTEDLHWCDPSSLEVLGQVMFQIPTARLLLLATARPEFQLPWPPRSHVMAVTLAPLDDAHIRRLLDGVSAGRPLPQPVLTRIAGSADGIPLYAEEIGRMVLESGILAQGAGGWELARPLDDLDIPTTLQDSLMARLDRLSTAKRVAQRAAVLGRTFSYGLLQAVADLDDAALSDGLERLVDAELLFQSGTPPAASYTFKHAMIQEAAYTSLLNRRRRELHSRAAHALGHELLDDPDAQPEIVARHHEAAGEAELAVASYRRAAELAARHSGFRESLDQLRHGIELIAALPDDDGNRDQELDMQIALGSAVMTLYGYADPGVESAYERARLLAEALGDERRLAQALTGLSIFSLNEGHIVRGGELAQRALDLAERLDDDDLRVSALVQLSLSQYYTGRFEETVANCDRAAAIYDRERHHATAYRVGTDQGVAADCFASMGLWHLGRPDAALARVCRASDLARRVGRPFDVAYAQFFESMDHWGRGEIDEMIELGQAVVAIAEEQGFDFWLELGRMAVATGRMLQAHDASLIPELMDAAAAAASTGTRGGVPATTGMIAEAMLAVGAHDQASGWLKIARAVADETGQQYWTSELDRLEGEVLAATGGPPATIEAKFRAALALSESQGAVATALRAATSLTAFLRDQGRDATEAEAMLRVVRARLEGGEGTRDARRADALLAQPAANPSVG